jgi:hypothetical protein
MAEILGPLGTSTSLLSLVFATIPTIMKFRQNYTEYLDQLRRYKLRVDVCEARRATLMEKCRGFNISNNGDTQGVLDDIERLREKMQDALQQYGITPEDLDLWQRRKVLPSRIKKQLAAHPTKYFQSTLYALYRKSNIDEWITSMEKSVECLERLLQAELELQTAGYLTKLDQDSVADLESVKRFIGTLTRSAKTLYKGTVSSPKTASTHNWALELKPADGLEDIENWELAEVDLKLSFSGPRLQRQQHFKIQMHHQANDPDRPITREQIEQAVMSQVHRVSGPTIEGLKCNVRQLHTRRTRPLGELFAENPALFLDPAWRPDRMTLIRGVLDWVLLLWDTDWIRHVCSYGLHSEKTMCTKATPRKHECTADTPSEVPSTIGELEEETKGEEEAAAAAVTKSYAHILVMDKCSLDGCRDSSSRLKNVGMVLAEIILATPFRSRSGCAGNEHSLTCEQLKEGKWEGVSPRSIKLAVRTKTNSTPFANAIGFCLTDVSKLATGPFQAGYILRCIQKIYTP